MLLEAAMAEVVLSVAFRYQPNDEVHKLLVEFREMINYCIEQAVKQGITSYYRLRKSVYEEFKRRWPNYATHYCHSACRIATSILRSWRRRGREPRAKKLFMRLDPQLYRFYGDRVRITVAPRQFLWLNLIVGEYQARFVDAWKRGELKVGEITVNEHYVVVPFRKRVDLENPQDWVALDINESNVSATATDGGQFVIDLSEVRRVHHAYFEIRRKIQRKFHDKPKLRRKLLEKYSRRERNRIRDLLHKASRLIVNMTKGKGIVLENLNGIRKRIHYGRKLNRRLHSWPFHKLQFFIHYKANLNGQPVEYVNPAYTSRTCPRCGGRIDSSERRCVKCGLDRDIAASINILNRFLATRCGEQPFPLKAPTTLPDGGRPTKKLRKLTVGQNGYFHLGCAFFASSIRFFHRRLRSSRDCR